MAFDGQPVKDSDVNWFHDQLAETNTLLRRSVVSLAGPPGFDEQEDAVDAFISSYDDTTPVFLLKTSEKPQSRAAQAAPEMFEGDVLCRPDVRWADDRFSATEMRPGGWMVAVLDPPHLRKRPGHDEAVPRAVSPMPSGPPPWLNDAHTRTRSGHHRLGRTGGQADAPPGGTRTTPAEAKTRDGVARHAPGFRVGFGRDPLHPKGLDG
jgi:hypothetical protein